MKDKTLICLYTVNINEKLVLDILSKIQKPIADWNHEILLLINSSGESIAKAVDDTIKNLKFFNVRILFNLQKLGYGGNQKLAFHYAIKHNFDIVLLLAGSGQYAPEQIEEMVSALEGESTQNLDERAEALTNIALIFFFKIFAK